MFLVHDLGHHLWSLRWLRDYGEHFYDTIIRRSSLVKACRPIVESTEVVKKKKPLKSLILSLSPTGTLVAVGSIEFVAHIFVLAELP